MFKLYIGLIILVYDSVDLIMWKDVSRSAFVFGIGTFFIVSSSYAKNPNLRSEIQTKYYEYDIVIP